jgi:hypothetical protein
MITNGRDQERIKLKKGIDESWDIIKYDQLGKPTKPKDEQCKK